jgi:hypothetical protein
MNGYGQFFGTSSMNLGLLFYDKNIPLIVVIQLYHFGISMILSDEEK